MTLAKSTTATGHRVPAAVTMGDPSGIGSEIAIKAWRALRDRRSSFFLVGDPKHFERVANACHLDARVAVVDPDRIAASVGEYFTRALPVLDIGTSVDGAPSHATLADATATIRSIERAVELVASGQASALVTNPITKDSLYRSGFSYPGHTEFLAELARRHYGGSHTSVMMLWSEELAVIPVTIHVALREAIHSLTTPTIVETARIAERDLRAKFGIPKPRIAISGLNPHAGENGAMGHEDQTIIAPAVAELRAGGIDVRGPLPADTMFHAAARRTYDVAICMYHDQALIPIKTIAFDSGVNVTLGLPFIRTSPDHGTAYDIAGKGIARADSLIAALNLADRLAAASMERAA